MAFSPQELKLIERLRRQERKWPRDRWILLVMGVFIFIQYGYIIVRILRVVESETFGEIDTLLVAFFWPKCLLMFCLASYFVALAIRDWHGNVNRMLLLKLLEAQLNRESKSLTGGN